MSKDKAEEKAREYALKQLKYHIDRGDKELTCSTEACINIAAKDYTAGYTQAVTDLSADNAQLREGVFNEFVKIEDKIFGVGQMLTESEVAAMISRIRNLFDKV